MRQMKTSSLPLIAIYCLLFAMSTLTKAENSAADNHATENRATENPAAENQAPENTAAKYSANGFAQYILTQFERRAAIPHLSSIWPQASEQQAYQIQAQYINLRQQKETIVGYKAGLTSTAGQQKFKVSNALSAALFDSGRISGHTVKRLAAGKLMLETEIGFVLARPITARIEQLDQLKLAINKVIAVIELPDLGYENITTLTGVDLIAANVASHQFILGQSLSVDDLEKLTDINQIKTELIYDGKTLFTGHASDALGDQWLALQWLINQLVDQGHRLDSGQILITGALGKMVAARPGDYQADFGPLGQIDFSVVD